MTICGHNDGLAEAGRVAQLHVRQARLAPIGARIGRNEQAKAAEQLESHRGLTGSTDELHVLADCYRAQKRWDDVEATWQDLRAASPSAATLADGRIVMAGSLADRGHLKEAIRLLEAGPIKAGRPQDHHLRLWFVLADLYERAGDVPRARALFERVLDQDSGFPSVAERLAGLS